jgi:signal transduction histidine kinase
MARYLNSVASRLWLLSGVMTLITAAVGLIVYRVSVYFQIHDWAARMPPRARAELEYLISTGQQGSDRYYELYDRFGWNALGWTDFPFLGLVLLISIMTSGLVAMGLARRISRPITAVTHAAARVSSGDRSVRVTMGRTTGELGNLIESFNSMAAALESYERHRAILTAGVAHELRTPLTILKGRLHALEDGVIDPDSGEAGRLLRQVEHLMRIVEDLYMLARAEAGGRDVELPAWLSPTQTTAAS